MFGAHIFSISISSPPCFFLPLFYFSSSSSFALKFEMEAVENAETHSSIQEPSIITNESPDFEQISGDEKTDSKDIKSTKIPKHTEKSNGSKAGIDTTAPFDSVKSAVSKFGGIVDWKAHKTMSLEKYSRIQSELEKVQEDIPRYKIRLEAAEMNKKQALQELDATNKLVEELKDSLEKTLTEEAQAKQDSELNQLRIKEIEQGISDEASHAAKAQLEVAKARHESAIIELNSVKEELKSLQSDYDSVVLDKKLAVLKCEEAVLICKEAEKKAEDLTVELITIKEALELAHSSHLEAEERRIGIGMARDQNLMGLENKLNQAKDELKQLEDQKSIMEDVKLKFETKSTMLQNMKHELASTTSKVQLPVDDEEVNKAKKELEEVNVKIEKAKDDVNCLKEAAFSLKAELDKESEALASLKEKQNIKSSTITTLETALMQMQSELEVASAKEKESKEKMEHLPNEVNQATQEADSAKSIAQSASEELKLVNEELEQTKSTEVALRNRLIATRKEIEASKLSESLAIQAVKAMMDSERHGEDGVTLNLEEYYTLSKEAHAAEELANERVITAIESIKEAKNSENLKLEILEKALKELEEKKEELKTVIVAAEKANAGKLTAEQELREWRSENEQKRRASDAQASHFEMSNAENFDNDVVTRGMNGEASNLSLNTMSCPDLYGDQRMPDIEPRKKKSFFPRIVMFLARKKAQSLK